MTHLFVDPTTDISTISTELATIFFTGAQGRVFAGLWGALWGSFFNVLICRLPAEESVVRPASHCRHCKAPIKWYDNIPLLSYLLLRGRCRVCHTRFSPRYFIVELLGCLLALLCHQQFVVGSDLPLSVRLSQFFIAALFCGVLVALTFIDLDTLTIPDKITYPSIPLCMLLSIFMRPVHIWDGLVGGVGGYLLIRLIADGYHWITHRDGMGYGDAKLLAMIGGLLGWQVLLPTLFLASLQGSLVGIPLLIWARHKNAGASQESLTAENDAEQPLRLAALPFGPFISLAAVELLFLRDYLSWLFPWCY